MSTKQYVTRGAGLKPSPRRYVDVYVPEEDGWYRLRSITELERAEYEQAIALDGFADPERVKTELLVRTCVDEQGELLFEPSDSGALRSKDHAITGRLYDAALAHCVYESGTAEDLRKNSVRRPAGGSP